VNEIIPTSTSILNDEHVAERKEYENHVNWCLNAIHKGKEKELTDEVVL